MLYPRSGGTQVSFIAWYQGKLPVAVHAISLSECRNQRGIRSVFREALDSLGSESERWSTAI